MNADNTTTLVIKSFTATQISDLIKDDALKNVDYQNDLMKLKYNPDGTLSLGKDGTVEFHYQAGTLGDEHPDMHASKIYCAQAKKLNAERMKMSSALQMSRDYFQARSMRYQSAASAGSITGLTQDLEFLNLGDDKTAVSEVTMNSVRTHGTSMSFEYTKPSQHGRAEGNNNLLTSISEEESGSFPGPFPPHAPSPAALGIFAEKVLAINQDEHLLTGEEKEKLCGWMWSDMHSDEAAVRVQISQLVRNLEEWRKEIEETQSQDDRKALIKEKKGMIQFFFSFFQGH